LFESAAKSPDTPPIAPGGNPNPDTAKGSTLASALGIKSDK
jgi:hypothetical protein